MNDMNISIFHGNGLLPLDNMVIGDTPQPIFTRWEYSSIGSSMNLFQFAIELQFLDESGNELVTRLIYHPDHIKTGLEWSQNRINFDFVRVTSQSGYLSPHVIEISKFSSIRVVFWAFKVNKEGKKLKKWILVHNMRNLNTLESFSIPAHDVDETVEKQLDKKRIGNGRKGNTIQMDHKLILLNFGPHLEKLNTMLGGDEELLKKVDELKRKMNSKYFSDAWLLCSKIDEIIEELSHHVKSLPRNKGETTDFIIEEIYEECCALKNEKDEIMRHLGYCCGRNYHNTLGTVPCDSDAGCLIAENDRYYVKYYKGNDGMNYEIALCVPCFQKNHTSTIRIPSQPKPLSKSDFEEDIYNKYDYEKMVCCTICKRKWHEICAMWDEDDDEKLKNFQCYNCCNTKSKCQLEQLKTTDESSKIEEYVNQFIETFGNSIMPVKIRILDQHTGKAEVLPKMAKFYKKMKTAIPEFPFTAKTVGAFQSIEGNEVCFFLSTFHEYGIEASEPNKNWVNIYYLDSVQYFTSDRLRSAVYRRILLGYFQCAKSRGFEGVHIWSCPPPHNQDYIFNGHPPTQKYLPHQKLSGWYERLIKEGIEEGIIENYRSPVQEHQNKTVTDILYFESGLWPGKIEELLLKTGKKNVKSKIIKEISSLSDFYNNDVFNVYFQSGGENSANYVLDGEHSMRSELLADRQSFLYSQREAFWEFSSLRRAKYSTMRIVSTIIKEQATAGEVSNVDKPTETN